MCCLVKVTQLKCENAYFSGCQGTKTGVHLSLVVGTTFSRKRIYSTNCIRSSHTDSKFQLTVFLCVFYFIGKAQKCIVR